MQPRAGQPNQRPQQILIIIEYFREVLIESKSIGFSVFISAGLYRFIYLYICVYLLICFWSNVNVIWIQALRGKIPKFVNEWQQQVSHCFFFLCSFFGTGWFHWFWQFSEKSGIYTLSMTMFSSNPRKQPMQLYYHNCYTIETLLMSKSKGTNCVWIIN